MNVDLICSYLLSFDMASCGMLFFTLVFCFGTVLNNPAFITCCHLLKNSGLFSRWSERSELTHCCDVPFVLGGRFFSTILAQTFQMPKCSVKIFRKAE
jgi:hypothetical protein